MHELATLIQQLMDDESMTRPELVRRSGLTRQHVQQLLTQGLSRMPSASTFEALHRAFPGVPMRAFVLSAASSAGIQVEPTTATYDDLPNETLLGILAARLEGGTSWSGITSPEESEPPRWHLYAADEAPPDSEFHQNGKRSPEGM